MANWLENGFASLSAIELAHAIRRREVSCVEVIEACLARIDTLNPRINAFCTVLHDQAREAARQADTAIVRGERLGPLHGIPVALKDLTLTKGVRTTRGSRLFEHFVPRVDSLIVERIRAAGGIIVGKTNTPEFGHKAVTDNLIFGATHNPWHTDYVAGGSSGGSGAAVAAGMVPLAEGSDGAGSIRIPASMCGVVGFKPSYGRVPDVLGAFSSHAPFFHNGPLARSVADAALLYQAMAGPDMSDPFSVPADEDVFRSLEDGLRGARIGYSHDLGCFAVDDEVRRVFDAGVEVFRALGCTVEEVAPDFDPDLERSFSVLWYAKLATAYAGLPAEQLECLEPKVRELIDEGTRLSAIDYGRATLAREAVWEKLVAVHRRYDFLVCPTTAVAPFPIAEGPPRYIAGREMSPLLGWFLTYPFNMTGNPAVSVPCGRSACGLPIGLQIVGRRLDDARVLQAARSYERIAPWPLVAAGAA